MVSAVLVLVIVSLALVEAARIIAGSRRAIRLNRAMHELRRPLQSISLSIEGSSPDLRCAEACLAQARVALEDLDAAINRRRASLRVVRPALGEIAAALEDRWRFAGVEVARVDRRLVEADPDRLGAALDNLVANAVEHGSGPVTVRALTAAGTVRFEVLDGGPAVGAVATPTDRRRHGHGLRVAGDLAAAHGGTVIPPRSIDGGGTVAALSLPDPAPGRRRPSDSAAGG